MFELDNPNAFSALGIDEAQLNLINDQLAHAQEHVHQPEETLEQATAWLNDSLHGALKSEHADMLMGVVLRAADEAYSPTYEEEGYDSSQIHRYLSKIVSEAILIGGFSYEAQLLGFGGTEALELFLKPSLVIKPEELPTLEEIAAIHGSAQDFIFPGVTPSSTDTPSLEAMALQTLGGNPLTSVRTVTGVGGLRADRDWNHVSDLKTFAELKVSEDKRYYPGIGIFYLLAQNELADIPVVEILAKHDPKTYAQIVELKETIDAMAPIDYEGVSILCSTFLPAWHKLKQLQGFADQQHPDISWNIHSPSYEFAVLRKVFEDTQGSSKVQSASLDRLIGLCKSSAWSFNSTIHLPWTSQLSSLSNGLIGQITNRKGDYGIRYGVGKNGKSIEVIEHYFGASRSWPFAKQLGSVATVKYYDGSDSFAGTGKETLLAEDAEFAAAITRSGFLLAALQKLEEL